MNKHMVTPLLLSLALGAWTSPVAGATEAKEESEHKEGKVTIPSTLGGIWYEVKEHEEELGGIIVDKKLDKVHEVAFEIRDLVNALPDKSKGLPADKQTKVTSNAKYVSDLATRLDKSGDSNDQAGTEANFKKLQGILKTIEAQYPPENLKYTPPATTPAKQIYACPMHPEVTSDKPGSCAKCGMKLAIQIGKVETTQVYACPMHPEVTSDKPGTCGKCGMALAMKAAKGDTTKDHH